MERVYVYIDGGNFYYNLKENGCASMQFKFKEFDQKLVELLKKYKVDLVCLIGYMRILTPVFIQAFRGKIINVHPALLPKFGGEKFFGKNVHEAVLASREKETGMTIHYVTEEVDKGEILLQDRVKIEPGDTAETLKKKVQALEKKWYPEVIRRIAHGVDIFDKA